ncbi:MAG: SRPBCC family protein [Pseudohongiellaceae bacterium]
MKHLARTAALATLLTLGMFATASAQTEYTTIHMEIDVDRPADEVWARVGDYCDIGEWLGIDCEITSGDGGIGTVRVLAGGRIVEPMVAKTDLSYGYTQPAVEGEFYDLYHGFLEARPVDEQSARLIYTLMLDQSNLADEQARQTDIAQRRSTFERALANMKALAEEEQ